MEMMMTMRLQNLMLLTSFILISRLICDFPVGSVSASSIPATGSLLGVSPQDESYYQALLTTGTVKCKDGSKRFTKSQLNDDFCDCLDGSDEPGTSACPNGSFYCKNAGHAPLVVYSSRVNDGICDCCDGSDEHDSKIKCPNTCWEAGKVAREKLEKKIATYQEGVTIRKQGIEQAILSIARDEAELSKLKDEEKVLKGLVDQLQDSKEQIEKAEEKERLQKEKEEKERREAELAKAKETNVDEQSETIEHIVTDVHDKIGTIDQPAQGSVEHNEESNREPELDDHPSENKVPDEKVDPVNMDTLQNSEQLGEHSDVKVDSKNVNQEKFGDEDTESLSREELGRRIASRWTGENTEQTHNDAPSDEDEQVLDGIPNETDDDEYHGYESEGDEHTYDNEDDKEDHVDDFLGEDHDDTSSQHVPDYDDESDLSDVTGSSSSSWLEKIQQTVKNIISAANIFQTPVNISDAEHIRKEYDESSAKLSKIQSRISSLKKKLKQDFGPEKEFYPFYGQCFESKQNKYVYKICPYKQATQEEGHSTTRLGSWEKFDDSYRTMKFSNGEKCWNGPDRSLTVRLRCGLKNEVADVDEPSRCEYSVLLSTPALCLESKLQALQEKLEALNKEQPEAHDEL